MSPEDQISRDQIGFFANLPEPGASSIATSFVTGRVAPFMCCPHHPDKAGSPSVQSRFSLFLTDVRKPEWFRFED
ncbi:hypothetical protein [Parasphingorhabdus sp.]|uniref:hypothetical protein n=1 Tax=Parasphingorhabdus sp. TaxID=2709688 RepID=UPI003BB14F27